MITALALGVAVAGLVALAPISAANASGSDILVSLDGIHYSATGDGGIFAKSGPIVPGQTQNADLYVQNNTGRSTTLALHATDITVDSAAFAAALELRASVPRGTASPAFALSTTSTCVPLATNVTLGAHERVKVSLALTMSAAVTGRDLSNGHASFNVLVSLRDTSEPAFPSSGCASGTSVPAYSGTSRTPLADTGSNSDASLAMAALLVGAGAYAIVAARRRSVR